MKRIAFDLMGNDNGVEAGVKASIAFLENNSDYSVFLVGDENEINKHSIINNRLNIIHSPIVANSKNGLRSARKENNSMSTAINLVKEGKADAVLSSGDSGIYLSMTTLILKRIEGIKRPAFMPIFPTIKKNKKFIMMDVGANLITSEEMIEQWAKMGSLFSSNVMNIKKPRVGIVNIGTEETKGNDFQVKAHASLINNKKINYIGFVESRDLLNHVVDVAIVDGYGGNLILKTMEGTVLSILSLIKQELTSSLKSKIGAFLARKAFKNVKESLDYRNVGSAWIIGLDGLALKSHGNSDFKSYLGAFEQLKNAISKDALNILRKGKNEFN